MTFNPYLEFSIIAVILEGIFYGSYCVIFGLYLRIQWKRRDGIKGLLAYALALDFILCTAFLAVHMSYSLEFLLISCQSSLDPKTPASMDNMSLGYNLLYYCIDSISQGILIYRCWMLWRRTLIVVVPVILLLGYLVMSSLVLFVIYSAPHTHIVPTWNMPLFISTIVISFSVNSLVAGLIISKVIIELKANAIYRVRGPPRDLYLILSTLVESGIITFVAQLLLIISSMIGPYAIYVIFPAILPTLFGISSTIILVRVGMGVSYDTEVLGITTSHAIQCTGVESSNNQTVQDTTRRFDSNNKQVLEVTTGHPLPVV